MSDGSRGEVVPISEAMALNAAPLMAAYLNREYLIAGLLMIPVALLARTISIGLPVSLLKLKREFSPHVVKILVWGGIRGGISVALALSLPPGSTRDVIVAITYVVVVFSITVQGLTIGKLAERVQKEI